MAFLFYLELTKKKLREYTYGFFFVNTLTLLRTVQCAKSLPHMVFTGGTEKNNW